MRKELSIPLWVKVFSKLEKIPALSSILIFLILGLSIFSYKGGEGISLFVIAIGIIVFSFIAFLRSVVLEKQELFIPIFPIIYFVPFFLYFIISSYFYTDVPWITDEKIFKFLIAVVFYFAFSQYFSRAFLRKIFAILALLILASVGYVIFFADTSADSSLDIFYRFGGFIGNPFISASLLFFSFFVFVALAIYQRHPIWFRLFMGYCGVLTLIVFCMMHQMDVFVALFLGLAAGAFIIFKKTKNRLIVLIIALCFLGGMFSSMKPVEGVFTKINLKESDLIHEIGGKPKTEYLYIESIKRSLEKKPFFGMGSGSFAVEFEKHRPYSYQKTSYGTDSLFGNLIFEFGLTGLVLFLIPIGIFFWKIKDTINKQPWYESKNRLERPSIKGGAILTDINETRLILMVACSSFLSMIVLFIVNYPLSTLSVFLLMALLFAVIVSQIKELRGIRVKNIRFFFIGLSVFSIVLLFWGAPISLSNYYVEKGNVKIAPYFLDVELYQNDNLKIDKETLLEAKENFELALKYNEENAAAYLAYCHYCEFLAQIEPNNLENLNELKYAAKKAFELLPKNSEAQLVMANSYLIDGKYLEAKKMLKSAIEIAPRNLSVLATSLFIYLTIPNSELEIEKVLTELNKIAPEARFVSELNALKVLEK